MKYIFSKDYRNAATWENRIEIAGDAPETLEALTMSHWIEKGLVFKLTTEKSAHGQFDKVSLAVDLYLPAIQANKANLEFLRILYQKIQKQENNSVEAFSECDELLRTIFKHAYEIVLNETTQNMLQIEPDVAKLVREVLDYELDIRAEMIKKTQAALGEQPQQKRQ